jgi:nucleoid-associated protein YgaU
VASRPEEATGGGPPPAPAAGEKTYKIQPGDSLSEISLRVYGSASHYLQIARANRALIADPNILPIGATITIPDVARRVRGEPSPAVSQRPELVDTGVGDRQTHVVQEGETLYKIAQRYLGNGTRYMDIYRANRDRLRTPDDLRAGITLAIPAR